MNITCIRRRWTPVGGAENYLARLADYFHQQRHSVDLICEAWPPHPSFGRIHALGDQASHQPLGATSFARLANRSLQAAPDRIYFAMERGIRADVYRAGDGLHRKWLAIRQTYRPLMGRLANWLNPKNREICKLEEATFDPSTTRHIIAISHMVKRDILSAFDYPQERISVIHNGVDYTHFAGGNRAAGRTFLQVDPQKMLLLLVGHGAERKGHRFAREVAATVSGMAELRIIDRPLNHPFENLYAAADLFLFPTLYDPFGSVVLEAMAAGLPVITTEACGASECIRHGKNGWIVPRADCIKQMVDYVRQALDTEERERMSETARTTAREMSFEKSAMQTLELCEQLFQQKITATSPGAVMQDV